MWSILHVAVVAPRTCKIVKNNKKIYYKMVYYTLCLDSVNRQHDFFPQKFLRKIYKKIFPYFLP